MFPFCSNQNHQYYVFFNVMLRFLYKTQGYVALLSEFNLEMHSTVTYAVFICVITKLSFSLWHQKYPYIFLYQIYCFSAKKICMLSGISSVAEMFISLTLKYGCTNILVFTLIYSIDFTLYVIRIIRHNVS